MKNIPAPTISADTLPSGKPLRITEWDLGAYTLRKFEEPDYTGWVVLTADHNLPRIDDNSPDLTPDFGVSCYSESGMSPAGAVAYAAQVMEAAQAAMTFNMIVASN